MKFLITATGHPLSGKKTKKFWKIDENCRKVFFYSNCNLVDNIFNNEAAMRS